MLPDLTRTGPPTKSTVIRERGRSTANKCPASHFYLCLSFIKLKWKLEARKPRMQSREGKPLQASTGYRRKEKRSEQQMESGQHIVLSED